MWCNFDWAIPSINSSSLHREVSLTKKLFKKSPFFVHFHFIGTNWQCIFLMFFCYISATAADLKHSKISINGLNILGNDTTTIKRNASKFIKHESYVHTKLLIVSSWYFCSPNVFRLNTVDTFNLLNLLNKINYLPRITTSPLWFWVRQWKTSGSAHFLRNQPIHQLLVLTRTRQPSLLDGGEHNQVYTQLDYYLKFVMGSLKLILNFNSIDRQFFVVIVESEPYNSNYCKLPQTVYTRF